MRTESKGLTCLPKVQTSFPNSLSEKSRDRLLSQTTAVPLPLKAVLYEPEEQPRYGYFLTSGVASVVATVEEGGSAEVGMIGLEGIVGSVQLLGPAAVPTQCFMQAEGAAPEFLSPNWQSLLRIGRDTRAESSN